MRVPLYALLAGLQVAAGPPDGFLGDPARSAAATPDTALVLPDSVRAMLSFVLDLRVAPDGSLYLVDRQLPFVVHLDRTGRLVRTLGRAGSGPGEFQRPGMLGWRGDSLWVFDVGLMRLTLFDTARAGHSTVPLLFAARPASMGGRPYIGGAIQPMGVLPGGDLLVYRPPPPEESGLPPEAWVFRVTREYEVLDTVMRLPAGHSQMRFVFREGALHVPQPFRDDPAVDISPDGRWLVRVDRPAATDATPSAFTVTVMEHGSRLAYRRVLPYQPLRLPEDTVEAFAQALLRFDPGPGHIHLPLTRDSLRRELYRPRFFPPVADVRVGRDGTVWFRLVDASGRGLLRRGEAQWVALSPRGFEINRLVLPGRLRVHDVDRHALWGVEYDGDGVANVRRYMAGARGEG